MPRIDAPSRPTGGPTPFTGKRLVIAAAILCAVLVALLRSTTPVPEREYVAPGVPRAEPAPTRDAALAAVAPGERTAIAAASAETAVERAAPAFLEFLERLVALGIELAEGVADGRPEEEILKCNAEAEGVLIALRHAVADCDARALHVITGLDAGDGSLEASVRRSVLERILRDGLAAEARRFDRTGERRHLDALVESILRCVPQDAALAKGLGDGLLVDRPYLGVAHESTVLETVDLGIELPYLRGTAARLLRTLWRNLAASGDRSSTSLDALALVFKDDSNPGRRQAALEHLLVADDGRYRRAVVQQVCESGDAELAALLGSSAANQLPPAEALPVLEELIDVGRDRMTGAFLLVGAREPAALTDCYAQHLADASEPHLRAELITGLAMLPGPEGYEIARVAFDSDPDEEVRRRALFLLSGHPDVTVAEQTLHAVLDDPVRGNDPEWLGSVVLALRNLTGSAGVHALGRVGARLRRHPRLDEPDRRRLVRLLADHLPR